MPMSAVAYSRVKLFASFLRSPLGAAISAALFSFAVCYFRSFVFPNVPIVLWGDQLGFFDGGSRMSFGQLPYRDYFQIVPPGTEFVYAILIKLFGVRIWIPNLVMASLAATTTLEMTLISSRLVRGSILLFPGLIFAGLILLSSMDATHHWFSTVAVLAAALVLLDGITLPRVAVAGGLCGVAACFTQSKGATVLTGLLVYLVYCLWQRRAPAFEYWQKCVLLCGAAAGVFGAFNAYFIVAAGIRQWLFCLIVYPMRYYPAPPINNWRVLLYDFRLHASLTSWVYFPFLYATIPLVFIVLVVAMRRGRSEVEDEQWQKLTLVAITGVAMFLAIALSPSAKRLGTVSPPALILLAWLLHHPGSVSAALRTMLSSLAIILAIAVPARTQSRVHVRLDLPGGRAAFRDPALSDEYRWFLDSTYPGEYIFGLPPLYSAFHLRNPAAIQGVHDSEYTRPEQVAALVGALEDQHVPLLVLNRKYDLFRTTNSPHDHLDPLRGYVRQNYQLTKSFPTGDDVWHRIAESRRPGDPYLYSGASSSRRD